MLRVVIVLALLASSFPVAALAATPTESEARNGFLGRAGRNLSILAAAGLEERGDLPLSAQMYAQAAMLDDELAPYFRFRAARLLLDLQTPPTQTIRALLVPGDLDHGYPGAETVRVRLTTLERGQPPVDVLEGALDSGDRGGVCDWLTEHLRRAGASDATPPPSDAVVSLHHGHCSNEEVDSFAEDFDVEPPAEMRLAHAEHLYSRVRFNAAYDELQKIDRGSLGDVLACKVRFREARTVYRLRRRSDAEKIYRQVARECTDPANEDQRVRALYAVGDRRHDVGDHSGSADAFRTLLKDYPQRSHADDAILYLARAARVRGDRKRELELLERALRDYRDGDMLFEIAWEVHEKTYRDGDYEDFVKAVRALDLPEHDEQYYSQGRLEYFVGQALWALKRRDDAIESWRDAWRTYPFSFYGYLAHVRLRDEGESPVDFEAEEATPPWAEDEAWQTPGARRLWKLALPGMAADVLTASAPDSPDARWRLALMHHQAGNFEVSHNIVRRTISGRPWVDPPGARRTQWNIAWPNPFANVVEAAVQAEAKQNTGAVVRAALPSSIMREESSFIEDIESYAGALGLMQLMPRTALGHDDDVEGEATPEKLKTAEVNVRVGVDHLFWLSKRFDGHPALMVAAYNAGSGAVGSWLGRQPNDDIALFIEDIPYLQTRNYTKRVIGSYGAYQWLSGTRELDARVLGAATK